jgi:hypothetical protein
LDPELLHVLLFKQYKTGDLGEEINGAVGKFVIKFIPEASLPERVFQIWRFSSKKMGRRLALSAELLGILSASISVFIALIYPSFKKY